MIYNIKMVSDKSPKIPVPITLQHAIDSTATKSYTSLNHKLWVARYFSPVHLYSVTVILLVVVI